VRLGEYRADYVEFRLDSDKSFIIVLLIRQPLFMSFLIWWPVRPSKK
jgi:hypothetical protein